MGKRGGFRSDRERRAAFARMKGVTNRQYKKHFTPFADADRDGVRNIDDCRPFDKKRHYAITSISDKSKIDDIKSDIKNKLDNRGYSATVDIVGNSIKLRSIRISNDRISSKGHNLQRKHGQEGYKRTRALSWGDWVEVNDSVNDVLDKHGVAANVKSLGGKFDIRDKSEGRRDENDWSSLSYENVGSMMEPIPRSEWILNPREAKDLDVSI